MGVSGERKTGRGRLGNKTGIQSKWEERERPRRGRQEVKDNDRGVEVMNHRERDRERERESDRYRDRHRERVRDRGRDRTRK